MKILEILYPICGENMQKMQQLSFLPESPYNPQWPLTNTLARKALNLLLAKRNISHPDFETYTGCWRLAAHIYILKKLGWPVKKQEIPTPKEENIRKKKNMCLYHLPQDCIDFINALNLGK
jgi:hypothetical protein